MISEYITFNAARFTKDYYAYKEKIVELERQKDDIDNVHAILTDGVHVQSSPSKDQVEKAVLRRLAVQEKINAYRAHIETFEDAYNRLLRDEKIVIDEFFTSPTKTAAIVHLSEIGIARTAAYEIRKTALDKIASYVAGIEKDGS